MSRESSICGDSTRKTSKDCKKKFDLKFTYITPHNLNYYITSHSCLGKQDGNKHGEIRIKNITKTVKCLETQFLT